MVSGMIESEQKTMRNVAHEVCPPLSLSHASHQRRMTVQDSTREKPGTSQPKISSQKKKPVFLQTTGYGQEAGLGLLLALEPRIMFDGAAFLTGAEVVHDQVTQDLVPVDQEIHAEPETFADPFTNNIDLLSALSAVTTPSDRKEIVFIDTRMKDYQTLMEGIEPQAEVILLDSTRDGIEQIAEALRGRSNIDGLHLIAEGNTAELHLGTTFLTQDAISGQYANLFTQMGQSLSAGADLLIYGCNFGEGDTGLEAMQTLADLTGADIAASTDRTGHVSEFANWKLEASTGFIDSSIVINQATQDTWEGVLATYTVTTTTDGGANSLRQAIIDANANAGTDTITFVGSGTYLLTIVGTGENAAATGDLDITDDLIITGNGVGSTVIDGGGIERIIDVRSSSVVTISGLTIQGGNSSEGGGISVDSGTDVTLSNVIVSGNTTVGNGGGIYNAATLSLIDTAISGNSANLGGGIFNEGTIAITSSTVSGNMADTGAGLYHANSSTDLTLTNATVSGNIATSAGGGLWAQQPATIVNSTFTLNSADAGGGIRTQGGSGSVDLLNTIVAGNTAGSANPDLQGNFTTSGYNLIGDGTGQSDLVNGVNNDQVGSGGSPINALLGGLANNGGPTQTHALLGGSPAINTGTATGAPAVDQRGMARDANVDIGAYEVTGNTAPTADAGGPYTIDEGDSLVINASASSDPDPDTLTYTWDLDGDGQFDDASGVNPTVTWATLNAMTNPINDDGSYTVAVRVDDGQGGVTTDSAALTVNNVAPTLTTTGAATIASGNSYTLNLSASDPGDDTISGWTINWGDGTIDTVAGNPPSVTHTYTNTGLTFNILASATDEDGTFLQNELLVPRYTADSIFRFEETTGAFLQQFAPQSGGLDDPIQTIIGPDGNLYATGERSDNVVRYNPITGAKIDEFVTANSGGLNSPGGLTFGPDGNLYVGSYQTNEVLRFNGTTGAFIDVFATGVTRAYGVTFGPDGNLYVNSFTGNTVVKFDGTTGASLGTFVTANAGGLDTPERMTFGPDGHLYIASAGSDEVLRYNGTTGAFIDDFVTANLGGLASPSGIAFGPDGNLYVGSETNDNILRYDGSTGAFLGEYVSAATGLDRPAMFTFLPGHQVLVTNAIPTLDLDANDSSGATGNDFQFTFTEGDGATAIADSDTDLVDLDSTTFDYITLSVSGLLDGNAETLVLDGDTFALATANPGQDTTGGNYRVVITTGAGTAIVTITKQGGGTFSEAETETLIQAIQYQHTDTSAPTDGDRLIDITVNDGTDDSAAARTTINVNPTNDPPVITSDGGGATAMVNAPENQTSVTTVTATDVDLPANTLTFTKTGGADAVLFNIDSGTGALTFSGARDFETFTDANSDGVYEVTVQVDDSNGGMDTQAISVTVTDVAEGNILTVDTTADYGSIDLRYGNTSSIGALLGDKGTDNFISLREAIDAANNTANSGSPDEIHFNIADNDPGHLYYQDDLTGGSLSSVATTTVSDPMIGDFDPDYPYAQHSWFRIDLGFILQPLDITDAVIINGYTQAGATQNTLSVGDNAELRIELTSSGNDGDDGLRIQSGGAGSSILGLVINDFRFAGIKTEQGADNVTVQGNFIGTDVTGTIDLGNGDAGIHLRSSDNQVGGTNVADRNVISGNQARGVTTFTFGPIETGNVIQNNYIGADATGIGGLGNSGTAGVQIYNQDGLQLLNNVIGDNANDGVRLLDSASIVNTVIQGNLIGVGADGTTNLSHTSHGIQIDEAAVNTTIGGILASQGNTIANNTGDGIAISAGTGTSIRGNRIFNNGGLGIDLLGIDGVNINDAGDGDSGPNNLQNFPTLTTAKISGTDLTVNGTLNSTAGTTFNIDFYASVTADGSGHGEAERYLGSASVTTDGSGNATISALLSSVGVGVSEFVTATATDSNGNTSEFSLTVAATLANIPPVAIPDGFTVNEGSTNNLNLAGNDTDPDDGLDLTSITLVSGPTNGTIDSINNDGTVDYTHNGSETLSDSFTYTINDVGGNTSNTVTVSLIVTPQNDAPSITSNGGGATAAITVIEGNTAVTDVNATDAESMSLTYSIIGGADAALFTIDPTTGVLTFITAPNLATPSDVGGDNVYDVVVQASDGTAADTQAIAVTVTNAPVIVLPPPPDPAPESSPPSDEGDGDAGESEDEALGGGLGIGAHSTGGVSTGSQSATEKDSKDSDGLHNLTDHDLAAIQQLRENTGMVETASNLLDALAQSFNGVTVKSEIQSLLDSSGFLRDLDQVRDAFDGATASEKTYMASSIAASTGLSIGYVFWLLRSGVLLTALLSTVPAWQFVNPLLVLDTPSKHKLKINPDEPEDDSVEAMFENHAVPAEPSDAHTEKAYQTTESRHIS